MSHSADHGLFNTIGTGGEPGFELALRGYDRKQVDRYVDRLVTENAALLAERDEVRRRSVSGDRASYRHLGARVEQILSLAEEEADFLKQRAANETTQQREAASKLLGETKLEADKARKDFETALAARRADEERADADRRAKVDAYVAEKTAEIQRLHRDAERAHEEAAQHGEKLRNEAQSQAEQLLRSAKEEAKRHRDEATAYAQQL